MPVADLVALRKAGRIAAAVRSFGAACVLPAVRLRDVCAAVEAEIERLGGAPAFPVQIAVNEVAAHFCPAAHEPAVFQPGDLVKLDVGVHVDGWVVDTAISVNLGGATPQQRLVDACQAALAAALEVAGPHVRVAQVSLAIESALHSYGVRPVENLCGHGVARWTVHCPPAIPNRPEGDQRSALLPGATVAIEVFATDGDGRVEERGEAQIHRFDPDVSGPSDTPVLEALRAFHGLPFAAHQLTTSSAEHVATVLTALAAQGRLRSYRPLVDPTATAIAQAEHTLYLHEDRVEVLTR